MRRLVAAALLFVALPAGAVGGWCAYEAAFPALPCTDGWAACRVAGVAVGGGTARDAAGRPLPADARIGWFDLEPGPAFSPFTPLSNYSGAPSAAMATMMAPVPAPSAPTPPVEVPVEVAPPVAVLTPSGRPAFTAPSGGSSTGGRVPSSGGAPAPVYAPPPATAPTYTPTAATGPAPSVVAPAPSPTVAAPAEPPTTAVIAPVAAPAAGCTDLVAMEPQAMIGGLTKDAIRCLEGRIDTDSVQTTRDKVSRLLIFNAEAKGDRSEWERLVKRHLEDIDRSDPDLCFKYALQLSRGGAARALGVIRWADTALDNKHRWEGATYKKRVFDLYRLRAEAASKLWAAAESEYTTGEHTPENEARSEKYRGMAKDYAREWLDYAGASAQETKNALALCVSASGNRSFCEGG